MKHWKKNNVVKAGQQQRTVLLRYYPPPAKGQKNDDRKMYEQHENHEAPLRCPVKLYEFYLSKWWGSLLLKLLKALLTISALVIAAPRT